MDVKAIAKNVRVTPSKARLVVDMIRGKNVNEAFAILKLTNKNACEDVSKVLKSACSNAVNNNGLDINKLFVKEIYVCDGLRMKRMSPRAKGRGDVITKRLSSITCVVAERNHMGQKVSPVGLRVGINREWDASWYANKNEVADLLLEDLKIRKHLETVYAKAAVSRILIERVKGAKKDRVKITLYTAKPGVVIGREAETKNKVVKDLEFLTKKEISLNVVEVKKPELDATLVAKSIAEQLEARASFRRVQKVAIQRALKAGAKGAKTLIAGRLGGAEMARPEGYNEGQVPLQTLRADVDYAVAEAHTTYGKLGIKVWIYKGEVLGMKNIKHEEQTRPNRAPRTPKGEKPGRSSKGGN